MSFPLDQSFIAEIEEVLAGLGAPANGETSARKNWPLPESAGCAPVEDRAICAGGLSGGGSMMRLMGGATVVALGVMLAPVAAQAQTPALVNARVEISAAVAGSSATLEAIERQANALDRARQAEIAALQTRLTEAEGRGAAEVASLQAQLVEAREALVTDLAARDRAYAREIAVFRREVTDIAATPEGAAALARFNAGDHVGAIAVLDRLIEAEDAARQTRANIESAVARRRVATLALDARGKGDPAFDTGAVIARYEAVVRLDPESYADWLQLFFLYQDAGRSSDALAATERMQQLSSDEQELGLALFETANALLSQGDRAGASSSYQRSLEIRERLAASDPTSVELARDLIASLTRIGDLILDEGDVDGALLNYQRGLTALERLSSEDPNSVALAKDLSVLINRVGDVHILRRDGAMALSAYKRGLQIIERLSAADPASSDLSIGLGMSLTRVGGALSQRGDLAGALSFYQRTLELRERLSEADPASAQRQVDVSFSLTMIGDMLGRQGDRNAAISFYRRSLEIRERLSAADPGSVDRKGDLVVGLNRIAATGVPEWRDYLERALAILRELESNGSLAESERPAIPQLEAILAAGVLP